MDFYKLHEIRLKEDSLIEDINEWYHKHIGYTLDNYSSLGLLEATWCQIEENYKREFGTKGLPILLQMTRAHSLYELSRRLNKK
jgi:hypothetical protein